MLTITIKNDQQQETIRHVAGVLVLGRQPVAKETAFAIADSSVSRQHVGIRELETGELEIENLSNSGLIDFDDDSQLGPGKTRVIALPLRFTIGRTRVNVESNKRRWRVEDDLLAFSLREDPRRKQAVKELDESVQFSAFRPRVIGTQQWYPLLVFAHVDDMLDEAQRQAARILEGFDVATSVKDAKHAIAKESELTIVPTIQGFQFNPPRQVFRWIEPLHRAEFRMSAGGELKGQTAFGSVQVYVGPLLLAEVPLRIEVQETSDHTDSHQPSVSSTADKYDKIFASYSHKDEPFVAFVEGTVSSLGHKYLRDCRDLRAGERWTEKIQALIREADVFQLFWSSNSMRSEFVRTEWEFALSLNRPAFIRPTYWEEPIPQSAEDELPPAELAKLHFSQIDVPFNHHS